MRDIKRTADDVLAPVRTSEQQTIERLRKRLASDADAANLIDVAYRTVDTAVGSLLLAETREGLVRVAYATEDHDAVLQTLADKIGPRILNAPQRLDHAARQFEEYFAGTRRTFDVALDFRLASGFRLEVLRHLNDITYGTTGSYSQVADAAGNPRAVRAVGSACATNPLPVVVPCHRVIRSDGTYGGYIGGADAKRALLTLEGAA